MFGAIETHTGLALHFGTLLAVQLYAHTVTVLKQNNIFSTIDLAELWPRVNLNATRLTLIINFLNYLDSRSCRVTIKASYKQPSAARALGIYPLGEHKYE